MKKVRLSELSEPVRSFLEQVTPDESIMVEDDDGHAQYGVIPYQSDTPEERLAAWQEIEEIQREVGQSLLRQGITENDVDRLLQEDG